MRGLLLPLKTKMTRAVAAADNRLDLSDLAARCAVVGDLPEQRTGHSRCRYLIRRGVGKRVSDIAGLYTRAYLVRKAGASDTPPVHAVYSLSKE
jgi:hypothetical protein